MTYFLAFWCIAWSLSLAWAAFVAFCVVVGWMKPRPLTKTDRLDWEEQKR